MKKKGLIVATIVMVLVLAVSLTTATYAWFTSAAEAEITDISVTVGESPNLLVGVRTTSGATAPKSYSEYKTGAMTFNTTSKLWQGDSALGAGAINFTASLYEGESTDWAINKAVSYTTTDLSHTPEGGELVTVPANSWFKAQGSDVPTQDTIAPAVNGKDYIDASFIVGIGKEQTVSQTYMKIVVTPDAVDNIGMAAALHFFIAVGDETKAEADLTPMTYLSPAIGGEYTDSAKTLSAYHGKTYANALGEAVEVGAVDGTTGAWTLLVPVHAYQTTPYATGFSTAMQVRLIIWVEGYDDACVTAYAGTGFTIDISFVERASGSPVDISATGTGDETV